MERKETMSLNSEVDAGAILLPTGTQAVVADGLVTSLTQVEVTTEWTLSFLTTFNSSLDFRWGVPLEPYTIDAIRPRFYESKIRHFIEIYLLSTSI